MVTFILLLLTIATGINILLLLILLFVSLLLRIVIVVLENMFRWCAVKCHSKPLPLLTIKHLFSGISTVKILLVGKDAI